MRTEIPTQFQTPPGSPGSVKEAEQLTGYKVGKLTFSPCLFVYFVCFVVVLCVSLEVRAQPAEFDQIVKLFDQRQYLCPNGRFSGRTFKYRLFVPRGARPGERFPLLIWFHGAGEAGDDNVLQMRWMELMLDDSGHAEKYRFFILVVQSPGGSWFDRPGSAADPQPDDMLGVTADIVRESRAIGWASDFRCWAILISIIN